MKASGNKSTRLLVIALLVMMASIVVMIVFDPSRSSEKWSSEDFNKMTGLYLESDLTRKVPEGTPDKGSGGALGSPWIAVRIPENAKAPEKWRVIDWNFGEISQDALPQIKMVIFCRERTEHQERVVRSGIYSTTVQDTVKIGDLLYCDAQSGEVLDVGSTRFTKQAEGYFEGMVYMAKIGTGEYVISDDTVRSAIREKAPGNQAGLLRILCLALYLSGLAGTIAAIVWKIIARKRRKKAQAEGTAV